MEVKRTGIVLKPNNSRVLFRPFEPATQERILKNHRPRDVGQRRAKFRRCWPT